MWEAGDAKFGGTIVDAVGRVTRHADDVGNGEKRVKRRRLDVKAGKKAIAGMLGEYGSDTEEDKREEENGMAALGAYASDDGDGSEVEAGVVGTDVSDEDEDMPDVELTEEQLLALVNQANALDAQIQSAGGDEDQVLWGDSENEEL